MKKFTIINLLIVFAFILGACGSSNSVVNNHLISKRKYTKGFHVNKRSNLKSDKGEEEVVALKKDSNKEVVKSTRKNAIESKETSIQPKEVMAALQTKESNSSASEGPGSTNSVSLSDGPDQDGSTREARVEKNEVNSNESNTSSKTTKSKDLTRSPDLGDPIMLILAIILALIIPPLAILIFKGVSTWFWVDLLLFIIGIGGFFLLSGLGWACAVAAIVIAFLVIFDVI